MSLYPKAINDAVAEASRRVGLAEPNAIGTAASFECGCFVRFLLSVNAQTHIIESASFRTNGCGYMVASAETIAQYLEKKDLRDLHGLEGSAERLLQNLGDFPGERLQCCNVVIEAVAKAFADQRQKQIDEFRGEKPLICTCFGVSEETVEAVIREIQPEDVSDVSAVCKAGAGCGSCHFLIREMIDIHKRENAVV